MTRQCLIINRLDADRLQRLIDSHQQDDELATRLESRLIQAEIVAPNDFPANRVSMRSQLRLSGSRSGESEWILHYPDPLHEERMEISRSITAPRKQEAALPLCIMSPLGIALLGLAIGESISLPENDGESDIIRIDAIVHQPEACGMFHL
ncbi:nucleoside diphosphate kinase regulator [Cobetia sp. L2A1]|uniref:nucleoside diphosphate kinase regulator n=1 Tax=Cobetia sp. L2A1 TaxID=2686360 RepID=UPI00131AFC58|nr:nucleoside diphosphate kinase regulator [Cobetia sp. L2A1]